MLFGGLRDGGQEIWTSVLFSIPGMYDLDRSSLKPFFKKNLTHRLIMRLKLDKGYKQSQKGMLLHILSITNLN